MKDLDFDELDRAVNSMVSKVPNANNSSDSSKNISKPSVNSVNISRSMDGISPKPGQNVDGILSRSANMSGGTQPSISLASRRSSGRFIDMIRPPISKPAITKPEPTVLTPRQPEPVVSLMPTPTLDVATLSDDNPSVKSESIPEVVPINIPNPDSITVRQVPVQPKVAPKPKPERTSIFSNNFIKRPTLQDSSELPESPFLTDAKVDKRPLGAFSGGVAGPDVNVQNIEGFSSEISLPTNTIQNSEAPLPAELSGDLLSIEASGTTTRVEQPQAATQPSQTPAQPTVSTSAALNSPALTTSERSSADNQTTTSIYDTSNYQKTISHPAKQKNGWMWIVWILALLVVGAGGGAAVYFILY